MKAELINIFGNDDMVVDCARVSLNKKADQYTEEQNAKLIRYCARNNHFSPFSHPKAQFRLTLPIFVARQWEKHRIGAVRGYDIYDQNETSRRYVDSAPEFYYPSEWRSRPDKSIKQGSGERLPPNGQSHIDFLYERALEVCEDYYNKMIAVGVAPEQARMILPQSMYTQWVETGSLSYWARVCTLRIDAHAQAEIRELAIQVAAQMKGAFPVSWQELVGNDLDAREINNG